MHPELINRTPFALSLLYLGREPDGELHGVALVQATWQIGGDGALHLLELQPEPVIGGRWYGDPAHTSLQLEPQTAPSKPGCDIVLLGHATAPGGRAVQQLGVQLSVGALRKRALVTGDRALRRGLLGLTPGAAAPFTRMPLVYERAFGGWDRRHDNPAQQRCEARNPVGVGYRDARLGGCEEDRLPNIEDPDDRYAGPGSTPAPCGFGFISAGWAPRTGLAGTYDEVWLQSRSPLLPADFDARFHNAASPGLVADALQGDEPVRVDGLSADGPCAFALPAIPAPWCGWSLRRRERRAEPLRLDTVIIDMDRRWLQLQWRGCWPLADGPLALQALELRLPALGDRARTALAPWDGGVGAPA